MCIAVTFPCRQLLPEQIHILNPAGQTLPCHYIQFYFGNVQPAPMFRCVMDFQPFGNPAGFRSRKFRYAICDIRLDDIGNGGRTDWPRHVRQLIFRLCRRVETVFSQLSGQLNAERVLARSFQGLCTHLANKILAYNRCMILNNIFGEDYELARIKKFVF